MTTPTQALVARTQAMLLHATRRDGCIEVPVADLRQLAALVEAREGEAVAWCPVDKNGHRYYEHTQERALCEAECAELNVAAAEFAPFTAFPLYAGDSDVR